MVRETVPSASGGGGIGAVGAGRVAATAAAGGGVAARMNAHVTRDHVATWGRVDALNAAVGLLTCIERDKDRN